LAPAPPLLSSGLPSVVKRLGWVSFFTDVSSDMIYPLLPAFLRSLGGGPEVLGVMEGAAEMLSAWIKREAGVRSDRTGLRKPWVVAGYALASIARPMIALAGAPWQVVVLRALDRTGKGLRSAPRDALVAGAVAPEKRGAAFGFHRAMDNAGATVGPLVAFVLMRAADFSARTIFALALVPALVSVAVVLSVRESPASPAVPTSPTSPDSPTPTTQHLPVEARRFLVCVGVFTAGASADSFLLLRLRDLKLDEALLPIAWLSLNAVKAITNVPGGRLADRIGRKRTILLAWAVYVAAYAAFPFAETWTGAWAIMLAYGAYYGLSEGGEKALLSSLAPKEAQGRAFGALHAVTAVAVLPANVLFGFLYAKSAKLAFCTSAAMAAAGLALLLVLVRTPGAADRRGA
jgi:MFS family permease